MCDIHPHVIKPTMKYIKKYSEIKPIQMAFEVSDKILLYIRRYGKVKVGEVGASVDVFEDIVNYCSAFRWL